MRTNSHAAFYFHQGTNYYSYNFLGCNIKNAKNGYEYTFRVWAPGASEVYLISDFCSWDTGLKMKRVTEKGVYEIVLSTKNNLIGTSYKYKIVAGNLTYLKGDPYALYSKGGADGASIIYKSEFIWSDGIWMQKRVKTENKLEKAINIYEIHLGSFLRNEDGKYLNYKEISEWIIPYIKYMGYTHVEFLPIMEYPFDDSWGYQICSFFAPTSRFGTPDDFKFLINELHKNFIGVILDFVPAHFPKDEWGLFEFDGKPLYEYQGKDRMESKSWGTRFFDLGREEIQSFLISAVMYYLREFHIDGMRFDAIASIIYLDYDKEPGKWVKNVYGGKESLEGISFLKKMNDAIQSEFFDVMTVAEESGDLGTVTKEIKNGGLGFDMKWNMGFSNDFFKYMSIDPIFRKYNHHALNFPIQYAFKEKYVLPISHDEVVHGKKSFIDKMFGAYEDKFRQMRCAMLFIMTFPGKKLTFMGTEFAQFREWDHSSMLEWFMLDYDSHISMREYIRALNKVYIERNELWEMDFDNNGFEWIYPDENEKNTVAYKRFNKKGNYLTTVINFSGTEQKVKLDGNNLKELFSTGSVTTLYNDRVTLPAFSGAIFEEKTVIINLKDKL